MLILLRLCYLPRQTESENSGSNINLSKLKDRQNNNETVDIAKLARNGSGITETIIKMGRYESISGSFIKIGKSIIKFKISPLDGNHLNS